MSLGSNCGFWSCKATMLLKCVHNNARNVWDFQCYHYQQAYRKTLSHNIPGTVGVAGLINWTSYKLALAKKKNKSTLHFSCWRRKKSLCSLIIHYPSIFCKSLELSFPLSSTPSSPLHNAPHHFVLLLIGSSLQ